MGFVEQKNRQYYSIARGKFTQTYKVTADSPGAVSYQRKDGSTGYVIEIDASLEGRLTGLFPKEAEINGSKIKKWCIQLTDGKDNFQIEIPYKGRLSDSFLSQLPNVDFTKDVSLSPNDETLFIRQEGTALKWAFTRENPNGRPDLKQVEFNGELHWDATDRMKFYEQMVSDLLPKIKEGSETIEESNQESLIDQPESRPVESEFNPMGEDDSDLPF